MLRRLLARAGYSIVPLPRADALARTHPDLDAGFAAHYAACAPHTMTSVERMYALYQAVRHVVSSGVEGDIVECGVWRGGSSMLAASTLLELGATDRTIWMYDTYEGMSEPGPEDVEVGGARVADEWDAVRSDPESRVLALAPLETVQANMARVAYPREQVRFVVGKVEDTIPAQAPERIAVLRLDTDWYESTRHELEHLYPRLAPGGVLIVDDYGHWLGARQAVDEFLQRNEPLLLQRVDYTGRMAIKPSARS